MRRNLPTLLTGLLGAVVGLGLLLMPLAQPLEAGPSKEFKEYGFQWKLPDDWTFGSPSPEDKKAGFVAKTSCSMASIEVWIYTAPTDGLDVAGRVKDVKSAGSMGLGTVNTSVVADEMLSGIKGKAVVMKVNADGNEGYFRTTIIESSGKFYQMLIRAWHGAQIDETEALNEVRKGFRLLSGAGGEGEDLPFDEFDSSDDSSDGEGDGGGGEGEDSDWPRGGAEKVGGCVKLPTHNMEWTLKKGAFSWTDAPTAETAKSGRFVVASAKVAREAKQEFDKDKPASQGFMDVLIQDIPPGLKVENWYTGGMAQKNVENWGLFDKIDTGRSKKLNSTKVGNIKGANMKFEGKKGGKHHVLFMGTATLRDKWYIFRAYMTGASDVWKHMRNDVGRAMSGVKFLDTSELARGPLIGAISDFAWHRGENADKEKTYKGPGYTFKKPKGMAYVKVRDSMNRDIRFTGEMRNKEGDAYLYFEIRQYKLNIPNTPNPKPEKFVNKRGEDWSAGAGETASVGRAKGDLGKKGSFNGGKGLTYEFTGDLNGVPYVEQGYVVKHKSNMFWFKFQYGGADAEKKLKKLAKKVRKGLKFTK